MEAVKRPVVVVLLLGALLGAGRAGPQAQELPPELQRPQQEQPPELEREPEPKQFPGEEPPQADAWGAAEWQEDALAIATARLAEQLSRQGLGAASPFALLLDPSAPLWGEPASPASPAAGSAARAAWASPALDALRAALPACPAPADLPACARRALLSLLDRVARARELRMWGGAVTVTADPNAPVLAPAPAPAPADRKEAEEDEARAAGDEDGLDALIAEKVAALAATRKLTLRLPPGAVDAAKRSIQEFRGKKGKGLLPALVVLALMMKGMLMALAMGTIALIAGKALTVGLMALVISGVIGLKKLASQGGGGYEVVNVQAPHHYARTLVVEKQNHLHPYRAHAPKPLGKPAATVVAAAAAASATDVSLGDAKDADARR